MLPAFQTLATGLARRIPNHPALPNKASPPRPWTDKLTGARTTRKPFPAHQEMDIKPEFATDRFVCVTPVQLPRTSRQCHSAPLPKSPTSVFGRALPALPTLNPAVLPRQVIIPPGLHWSATGNPSIRGNLWRLTEAIHQSYQSTPQEKIEATAKRWNRVLTDMSSDFRVNPLEHSMTVCFATDEVRPARSVGNTHQTWQAKVERNTLYNMLLRHLAKEAPANARSWLRSAAFATTVPTERHAKRAYFFAKQTQSLGLDLGACLEGLYVKSRELAVGQSGFDSALRGQESRV